MKIKHIVASIILAVSATSTMAATFSLNGVLCGNSSGLSVDSLGNVSATISGTNACSNSGNGTPPVIPPVVPTTPPSSASDSSPSYPANMTQAWGPMSSNTVRSVGGINSFVWRAPTASTTATEGALSTTVTSSNSAYRIVSISKYPNDFNVPTECKSESSSTTDIKWNFGPVVYRSCNLVKGVTYYINISHQQNGKTTCTYSACTFLLNNKAY